MRISQAVFLGAGLLAGCGGDSDGGAACGEGTTLVDGTCVADVTCGDGMVENAGACVPVGSFGVAPEVTSAWSPTPFPGGGLLVIEGDHFTNADGGTLVVEVAGAPAVDLEVLSDDVAVARLPSSEVAQIDLRVASDQGEATTTFTYRGLWAAEGGSGDSDVPVEAPGLYVVDPRNGHSALVGPLLDGDGVPRAVTGLAQAPDGTLWATEARDTSDPDTGATIKNFLMTIDPATAAVTLVAELFTTAEPDDYYGHLPDLAFVGADLYAWTENSDDLARIDLTTGEITEIPSTIGTAGSGLALLDDGSLAFAPGGASTGALLYKLDTAATELGNVSLTSPYNNDEVPALASDGTYLFASVRLSGDAEDHNGLMRIDPRSGEVAAIGEMPLHIDALETPADLATLALGRRVPAGVDLARFAIPTGSLALPRVTGRAVALDDVLHGVANRDARGRRWTNVASVTGGAGATVTTTGGATVTLDPNEASSYRLVENRRGQFKLVGPTGEVRLRQVARVDAR